MSIQLQLVLIIGSALFLIITVYHIRSSSLETGQSIRWFVGAVILLLLALFPDVVQYVSRWAGVEVPSNLIFMIMIAYLLVTSLSLSASISKEHAKTRKLVQDIAILEKRVKEMEKILKEREDAGSDSKAREES